MIVRHGKYFLNSRIDNLFTSVAFDSARNVRVNVRAVNAEREERKAKGRGCFRTVPPCSAQARTCVY